MQLPYEVHYADGRIERATLDVPDDKPAEWWKAAKPICQAVIGEHNDVEHVKVWHDGVYRDMFIDGDGQLKGLPRNERATAFYRANALAHQGVTDPESIDDIAGDAVLFFEKVWR